MTAIAWLTGALLLSAWVRHPAAGVVAALLACIAGTTLPDIDLSLHLGHRSGLTHSLLPVLVLLSAGARFSAVPAGLALGIGTHLAADCFPNAMIGYAMVKLPGWGSIGTTASYAWLAVNAVLALLAGAAMTMRRMTPNAALATLVGATAIGVAYWFVTDGGWPILAIFGLFGWLEIRRRKARRRA